MTLRLPAGAKKIREILDDKNKSPEQKLAEIEEVVNYKLRPKVRNLSSTHDSLRPEVVKISRGFYLRLKSIIDSYKRPGNNAAA
jgi:hypothetical protein